MAPLVEEVEVEEVDADADVEVPFVEVALPVIEAEEPVSDGPDDADPVGSAVPEVAEEPVAVVLPPPWILSRPAVIVTGNRLFERSLAITPVVVPGSFASGPAAVSAHVAVSEAILQSTSIVLWVVSQHALFFFFLPPSYSGGYEGWRRGDTHKASASVTWRARVDGPLTKVIPGPNPHC